MPPDWQDAVAARSLAAVTTTVDRTNAVRSGVTVELRDVSRTFGQTVALAPTTLTLHEGTVSVVGGANGAGKTTLLRVAAGLLKPSSGRREIHGRALYLPAGGGVRSGQTPRDAVVFAATLAGAPADPDEILDSCALSGIATVPAGRLSTGQRVRVTLAVALAARASLLCLDEPTSGLDAAGVPVATGVLAVLRTAGCAVLVASHDPRVLSSPFDARLDLRAGRLVQVS